MNFFYRISSFLGPTILLKIYKMTILPILDYGCIVWGLCSKKNSNFLERLQNKAMRIILRTNHLTCTQSMRERLGLLTLFNRRRYLRLQLVYKIVNDYHCPRQLQGYFALRSELRRNIARNVEPTCALRGRHYNLMRLQSDEFITENVWRQNLIFVTK